MKRSTTWLLCAIMVICGSLGLYGAPEQRGSLSIDEDGNVLYLPLIQGQHDIPFNREGLLHFDSATVETNDIAAPSRRAMSALVGKRSVAGSAIQIERRSMSEAAYPSPNQRFLARGDVYHFEPEGLAFQTAATLTLPYQSLGADDADIDIYYYNKETQSWELQEKVAQDTEKKTITIKIRHFSDYVAGMSSFKIDEAGSLGASKLGVSVDPYLGSLLIRNTEFDIPARGVSLSLNAKFNSDYLYCKYLPEFPDHQLIAGKTLVPVPNSYCSLPQTAIDSGWSYELPYCSFGSSNSLFVSLGNGRCYSLNSCVVQWAHLSNGAAEDYATYYRISRPDSTHLKILIPEANIGIHATISDTTVTSLFIYNADGTRAYFPASGYINRLYDKSGLNYLQYTFSGGRLQRITHTDGRSIKMYSYTNSSSQKCFVYVLSSSSSLDALKVGDEFLARRVFDTEGRLLYADSLMTLSFTAIDSGFVITSTNETSYFAVQQRTTYGYSINSNVANNYIEITEPYGGYKKYVFKASFMPNLYSSFLYKIDKTYYYKVTYQNKPKVAYEVLANDISLLRYRKKIYVYQWSHDHTDKTCTSADYLLTANRDGAVKPSPLFDNSSELTKSTLYSYDGTSLLPYKIEVLSFSHSDGVYCGVSQEEIDVFTTSTATSAHEKRKRTFSKYYGSYYPNQESLYRLTDATPKWTKTYTYDSYGRVTHVDDTRCGTSYILYLYGGQANGVFAYPYAAPTTRDLFLGFNLVAGTAEEQKSGVYATTYYEYDAKLNVTKKLFKDSRTYPSSASADMLTQYAYDGTTNNLTSITYPAGNVLSLTYGSGYKSSFVTNDKRSLGVNRNGTTEEFAANVFDYDIRGRPVTSIASIKDASGTNIVNSAFPIATYAYSYDGLNRVTAKSRTVNGVATLMYKRVFDDTNRKVTTTDAKGFVTVNEYDTFFRLTKATSYRPDSDARTATYDGTGKVAIGTKTYTYDTVYMGNVLSEKTYADGAGTNYYLRTYTYDNLGRNTGIAQGNQASTMTVSATSYDDATNAVTAKTYQSGSAYTAEKVDKDWLDRVESKTSWSGAGGTGTAYVTSYGYDYAGHTTSMTLPNGEAYSYTYRPSGLLEKIAYPGTRGTEYRAYDLDGRLTSRVDVGGNTVTYGYNGADLETSRTATATGKDSIRVATTYTQHGPYSLVQTRNGATATPEMAIVYGYDGAGHVVNDIRTVYINGTQRTLTRTHAYDAAGNPTGLGVTGFDGYTKSLAYSTPYLGGAMIGGSLRSTSLTADGIMVGRASNLYWGGMDEIDYVSSGRYTTYTNYNPLMRAQKIDNPDSPYDQTYAYDYKGNVTAWNGTTYAYDGQDRLSNGYTYDIINNITTAPSASYTYKTLSTKNTMHLATATLSGTTRTVTDDGKLGNILSISGKLTNLSYDSFNRLISLNDPARPNGANPSDTYSYDPSGLRYARTETAVDGSRTTTYYVYEGNSILYEESWKDSSRTKSILNLYLGGTNIGRYVQTGGVERLQYFYNDHLGSRRAVTDGAGIVQAKIDYTTWGVPTVTNYNGYDGSQDITYTGKEYDATKLYYFNARYYDASMGRFISEDPARDEMNWYAYCGNNPVSFTDPMGMDCGNPGYDGIDENGNKEKITDYSYESNDEGGFDVSITTESTNGDTETTEISKRGDKLTTKSVKERVDEAQLYNPMAIADQAAQKAASNFPLVNQFWEGIIEMTVGCLAWGKSGAVSDGATLAKGVGALGEMSLGSGLFADGLIRTMDALTGKKSNNAVLEGLFDALVVSPWSDVGKGFETRKH
jgi:RHS repeat-associated protein